MDDNPARREHVAAPPRRVTVTAELGANISLQDGEDGEVYPNREPQAGPGRRGTAGRRMERRDSLTQGNHQRHMPMGLLNLPIPRKAKEKRLLLDYVSTESREYEDMRTILTSSYVDTTSDGCFTYCKPRLIHNELLEKEFVEKRKEMKSDGRTDKELEESYCFLLADYSKVHLLCEKGLLVGQSWITVLGNPSKGVYLSRYSDLLQVNSMTPGAKGDIVIFKVMKGKMKSIYENMKNLFDPTPRFDSHISKNASKITSLTSYRAFELTQQYFYEYSFDELRQRPRQVCPYAVVSFHFKGKDSPLPSMPLAPIRSNSHSSEGSKERVQFTVWTGDLVKGDRVLFQICLRSFSPPILPHRLPDKLDIGWVMSLKQVTKLLPSGLFSYDLYSSNQEVVKGGHCCSLLEVTDRSRSTASVTRLLHELEMKSVVLVTPLTEGGFLFLLSSVQMATPSERGENWKRCLHALFVLPESKDVATSNLRLASSSYGAPEATSGDAVMPRLSQFIPALHHALVKVRADPPPELSAGVERQAQEYFVSLKESKVRQYPMGQYDSKSDEQGKLFVVPKHHRVNMKGYLGTYLHSPALYLLSVARAKLMVETHCILESKEASLKKSYGGQREAAGKEVMSSTRHRQSNTQKVQQLIDLVLTCKRNAENEVNREERGGAVTAPGRKRRREQETAERALKFLRVSQEPGKQGKVPVEGSQVSPSPGPLASVIGSLGLKDVDLTEDGSEQARELLSLLTGLSRAARGKTNQSVFEVQEGQRESSPFDKLAAKLGLPTNCDIDLRKQEDLEEQTTGSVSSLEGFSPSSHSGELSHYGAAGRGGWLGRREGRYEEDEEGGEIPWVLIPITGLCSERYSQRDRNVPQDPRFQRFTAATGVGTAVHPSRRSPAPSPAPSPFLCPSPELSPPPSPSQCPSPDPSPLPSPSRYPSPEPSSPGFPSQCPSPEPGSTPSPRRPSPEPGAPPSPSQRLPPKLSHRPTQRWSPEPNELRPFIKDQSGANEEQPAPRASRECAGVFLVKNEPQEKELSEEPSTSPNTQLPVPPALQVKTDCSPSPAAAAESSTEEVKRVKEEPPEKETKPPEPQKGGKESEHVVEVTYLIESDEEQKVGAKELSGGSFPPPDAATPSLCLQHIDSIVDKHLGAFSSDIQLVLQKQNVRYSPSQSPHAAADAAASQHTRPCSPISRFSPYVSFYNACPPVQDYVSSLHDSISSMLSEVDGNWPGQKPAGSSTNTDPALASRVSDFVSSIRAANDKADDDAGPCGGVAAADRGGEVRRQHAVTPDPNAASKWNPSASHVTLSVATSAPGPAHKPTSSALPPHPGMPPASHRAPQQSQTIEVNIRQTPDSSVTRTVHCTDNVQGTSCTVTLSGLSSASKPSAEQTLPPEPAFSLAPAAGPPPPATALSSLIRQLQPEVFTNLEEIMKDIKKHSSYFYFHSVEPEDQVYKDVREHLLKQGNVEQSPRAFVNQDNSDSRLLVIIKNGDIAGHIHKIPGLVALKRHPSVAFVGIDTLDDITNKTYNKLFVSGGCIISDESILNPDFITPDRLTALLMLLEQHSSPESIWKWKVHCRTNKKLKEQSRFRRDAANLLDVLATYQERQIVEFLPYHSCDIMNHHSPDQDCLMELQARHTKYRHMVLLTEHRFVEFPAYFSRGIMLASPDEFLNHFTTMVGYHDIKDNQPTTAPKEDIHSLSFHNHPKPVQSSSGLPTLPCPSDVPLPDASWKDGVLPHSGKDLEALQRAILKLRAERQAQQQQRFEPLAETSISPVKGFLPNSAHTGGHHTDQPLGQGGPSRRNLPNPGKKAMTVFLDSFHSALQLELDEQQTRKGRAERRTVESPGGGVVTGEQRDSAPVMGRNLVPNSCDKTIPSSNQNTASSKQTESASDGGKRTDQRGEPSCSKAATQAAAPSSSPADAEVDRSCLVADFRDSPLGQDQSPGPDGAAASSTKVPETTNKATDREDDPKPAGSGPEQIRPSQQLQGATSLQQPLPQPYSRPPLRYQLYSHRPFLAPLGSLRGGLLGPVPVPTLGVSPASAAALLWGFPPVHGDFTGPRLLSGYQNPAGQGGGIYRGGRRGGGFSGM